MKIDPQLLFKCKCGAVQADIKGKLVEDCNCHCHSCVAAARHVESKPEFDGFSALNNEGGFAYAVVKGKNINFTTDIQSEEASKNIDYVKVGPKGKMARTYCKGCGTVLGGFQKNFAFLNRHAIFHQDGTPYFPPKTPINIMKKHAFDPAKVPEPSVQTFSLLGVFPFIPLLLGFGGKVAPKDSALYAGKDMSKVEVVPITWE
ncbi:hypothetical protein ACHAXT_011045 [Thalassiosira profunda]